MLQLLNAYTSLAVTHKLSQTWWRFHSILQESAVAWPKQHQVPRSTWRSSCTPSAALFKQAHSFKPVAVQCHSAYMEEACVQQLSEEADDSQVTQGAHIISLALGQLLPCRAGLNQSCNELSQAAAGHLVHTSATPIRQTAATGIRTCQGNCTQLLGLTLYPLCGQHTPGGKGLVGLRDDHLQTSTCNWTHSTINHSTSTCPIQHIHKPRSCSA